MSCSSHHHIRIQILSISNLVRPTIKMAFKATTYAHSSLVTCRLFNSSASYLGIPGIPPKGTSSPSRTVQDRIIHCQASRILTKMSCKLPGCQPSILARSSPIFVFVDHCDVPWKLGKNQPPSSRALRGRAGTLCLSDLHQGHSVREIVWLSVITLDSSYQIPLHLRAKSPGMINERSAPLVL